MKNLRFTIIKNGIANVTKGGATALVALVLPHFLTRSLDHDRFAAWALMLQLAAYASVLDFGLQTAVARFLAYYTEIGDTEHRTCLVNTALALLSVAAILGVLAICLIAVLLTHIFHGIPGVLLSELRRATLLLGGSTALLLPFSVFSGVLVGLHRNEQVAVAVGGSRILGALAVLVVVRYTNSLVLLALCIAVANLAAAVLQLIRTRVLLPSLPISYLYVRKTMVRELGAYCAGLTLWSLSMVLISGVDLIIVGHFDFAAAGYYSIATAVITLFNGVDGALCSALMTPIASLDASQDLDSIRTLILSATRLNTFANLLALAVLFLCGPFLLRVWVGASYAVPALRIVEILMVAFAVRLVASPYAFMLIATDQQRYGIAQAAVEGLVNLGSSVLGAIWWGPIGVAIGTLLGAICGLLWTSFFTVKWVRKVPLGRWNFVKEGVVRPLGCMVPLLIFSLLMRGRLFSMSSAAVLALCGVLTYLLTNQFGAVLPGWRHQRKLFA